MALSKSTNTYNRTTWEDSEFPILCQTCLGDNPYVRMMKERYGMECKICNRPFTTFRWCPGKGMRYKKTEICQTCCKIKNVCQTCLLDLEYGLPVQVRDHALQVQDNLAKSAANRDYFIQNADRTLDKVQPPQQFQEKSDMLERLARQGPFYR